GAVPNMRENRLRPIMEAPAKTITSHAALSEVFGVTVRRWSAGATAPDSPPPVTRAPSAPCDASSLAFPPPHPTHETTRRMSRGAWGTGGGVLQAERRAPPRGVDVPPAESRPPSGRWTSPRANLERGGARTTRLSPAEASVAAAERSPAAPERPFA